MKRVCVLAVAVVLTLRPVGAAKVGQAGSQPQQDMPMPLVAPLFVETAEVSSTASIVNAAAAETYVDVVLLDEHGMQIITERIQIPGHSGQAIRIAELLQKAGSAAGIGSVEILPEPTAAKSMSVVAQVSITDNRPATPVYLEEEVLMPSMTSSNTFIATASSVRGYPVLALMSTSMEPQTVTVTCLAELRGRRVTTARLAPGEMAVIEACKVGDESRADFEDLWRQGGEERMGSVGLSVVTAGMPGQLDVYGFALRGGGDHPSYTALNFKDAGMLRSSNTVFAGVPVGQTDVLPGAAFKPEIAVANFGTQPATAQVLYATEANDPKGKVVADVALEPQSSKTIELPAIMGDGQARNSFILESKAPPGTLAANLVAEAGPFGTVQLVGKDAEQLQNGGAHPWTTADGASSTLLLFNYSREPRKFYVAISAAGVLWQETYEIAALETTALDIGKLISTGAKDEKGHVLPLGAKEGVASWFTPNFGQGAGRLLVSRADTGLARNFSCYTSTTLCGSSSMQNSNIGVPVGGGGSMGPYEVDFCLTQNYVCGGSYENTGGWGANWSPASTSVYSIPNASNVAAVTINGISAGSGAITATAATFINGCGASPQNGNVTVVGVSFNSVNLVSNQISTTLSPTGASGPFSLWESTGSSSNYSQTAVSRQGRGQAYVDGFNLTNSAPTGQYSTIYAAWSVAGIQVITSYNFRFYNYGNTHQTQYTLINEGTCATTQGKAYIITNLAACFSSGLQTSSLSAQFMGQTALNGSGDSRSWGLVKGLAATSCKGATTGKPGDANYGNTFVQVSSITGSCNQPLSGSTVAQFNRQCGLNIFIEGYGSPGTQKSVQDECPRCQNDPPHFDNWTTAGGPACGTTVTDLQPGSPPGYFVTEQVQQ